jgi:pimeloyl-ACP methyl ester carboxylesterase
MDDISYTRFGEGPKNLVFIHGFCEIKEMWDDFIPLIPNLDEKYTVYTFDLPGFGNSPFKESINSLDDVASILIDSLNKLGIKSASFIGHSMGGYVMMSLLNKQASIAEKVCLFHSSIFADSPEKTIQRNKTIAFIRKNGKEAFLENFIPALFQLPSKTQLKEIINRAIDQAKQNEEKYIIRYLEFMRDRHDYSRLIKELEIPFHFIIGRNDNTIPIEKSLEQSLYPKNSTKLILDCGHMGMFEKPNDSSSSLQLFLEC